MGCCPMKNSSLGATGAMKGPPMLVPLPFFADFPACLSNFLCYFYCLLMAFFSDLDSFLFELSRPVAP